MSDILLIGSSGQLGGSLLKRAEAGRIVAPSRADLDVENTNSVLRCLDLYRPEVVINTAAFHNVPICEEQPDRAMDVNCFAVYRLSRACADRGIRLVSFSTDYVFDGNRRVPYAEDDLPSPLQIYGFSRLAGEHAAIAPAPAHTCVVRTCGLYGFQGATSKGGNFVDKRMADARQLTKLDMSSDQTVTPTSTDDLADAVLALIDHPNTAHGIYHLVNQGQCTWAEFTAAIYELSGVSTQVNPVDRGGISGAMRRPLYSVLANKRAAELGIKLPHWRNALKRYLGQRGWLKTKI